MTMTLKGADLMPELPVLTDEQKKVLSRVLAVVAFGCIGMAALLGGDIEDEVCGNRTVYVCSDGMLVGNPDNCPKTTTSTTLSAVTTVPATTIPVTTLPPTTSIEPSYCTERSSGTYCDGNTLVECGGGVEISEKSCDMMWSPKVVRYNGKIGTEWREVPGLCSLNSEGADCCTVEICG